MKLNELSFVGMLLPWAASHLVFKPNNMPSFLLFLQLFPPPPPSISYAVEYYKQLLLRLYLPFCDCLSSLGTTHKTKVKHCITFCLRCHFVIVDHLLGQAIKLK
jgi:hypothetical protein